jgi:hypothetical protein
VARFGGVKRGQGRSLIRGAGDRILEAASAARWWLFAEWLASADADAVRRTPETVVNALETIRER